MFFLLILFSSTQLGKHFWPDFTYIFGLKIDYLSPTLYLTDVYILCLFFFWFFEERKSFASGFLKVINTKFLLIFFIYLFINSALASNPEAAFYKLLKISEFTLLGVYIVRNYFTIFTFAALGFSVSIIGQFLLALLQIFKQGSIGGPFWLLGERTFNAGTPGISLADINGEMFLRPYGTFSHPNSLAGFVLVSLLLLVVLGNKLPVLFKRTVFLSGITLIVLSFSRSVWLTFFVVLTAFIPVTLAHLKSRRNLLIYSVLIYLPLFALFFWRVNLALGSQPVEERILLSKASLAMLTSSPFFGVGLNNFIVNLPNHWNLGNVYFLQPVHNLFLLVASETGLLGLFFFLTLIIGIFMRYQSKKFRSKESFVFVVSFVSILFSGLFDHYWFTLQQNMLLLTVVLGFLLGSLAFNSKTPLNRLK
ncbi:MAG: O-antigen ligase family protein [bacterium]|nr:O-antigen ligase family protein [bacterium]